MKNPMGKIILVVLVLGLGGGIWWQAEANMSLRKERARLQALRGELARLREGKTQNNAAVLSADEHEALQREADEAAALRSRVEKLKAAKAQLAAPKTASAMVQKKREEIWHNAGQATPSDTLHTVIWTAVNGDVDTLIPMLAFDPESRAEAEALRAWLPESARAQFPTVEKLVATLISGRMSTDLNQAVVLEQINESPDLVDAKVELQRAYADVKELRKVTLRFQRDGSDWRLLVPKSAIAEYKRSLEAP